MRAHHPHLSLGRRVALRTLASYLITFVVLRMITAIIHRLGGMDVSGGSRVDPRLSSAGTALVVDPCIPKSPGFTIAFQYHSARYEIAPSRTRMASATEFRAS
jgi:hypothetical protein